MGIPSYYKNIIQDYPEIILPYENFNISIDHLFFDLNCAIHPWCANKTDENEMYDCIFLKIQECISLTKVRKLVYLAIDGPAPRTKMEQQRQRRLRSSQEKKIWDTNQITPGTPFMNQLSIYLHKRCKEFNIPYIISDSNEPGEGEHKIMHYMDTLPENSINIVYGLDADLIMLSMIRKHTVYLLRERTEYNIENLETQYVFCNILLLKQSLLTTIKKESFHISNETVLFDYLFLCFFIGNDFIIHTPSINIRYRGLDHLLTIYNTLQEEYYGRFFLIDENKKINLKNFQLFLKKLSLREKKGIQEILKIRENQGLKYRRIYNEILQKNIFSKESSPSEIQDHSYESLDTSEDTFIGFQNHLPVILRSNENKIFRSKKNYYLYHLYDTFHYNPSYEMIMKEDIQTLCKEYLQSMVWTVDYYFNTCPSWKWYYQYHFTPLLTDLSDYVDTLDDLEIIKKDNIPHTPEEQLKIVLPLQDDIYLYPLKTPLYTILKRYYWECHPILPH